MFFFFQAEDGIRDLVRSRGLGDVYKRQRDVGRGHVCVIHATDRPVLPGVRPNVTDLGVRVGDAVDPANSLDIVEVHLAAGQLGLQAVSYTHLRAHETVLDLVCRLLLEKKKSRYKQETSVTRANTPMNNSAR